MKTWLGLLLTVLGLAIGLGTTLLNDVTLTHTEYANFLGISVTEIADYSPTLIGLALLLMIVSFFLIFANREDEMEY